MTDLQAAFEAMAPQTVDPQDGQEQAVSAAVERPVFEQVSAKAIPKRLPIKQFLEQKKEEHKEVGPMQLMFQNVHPNTTRPQLVEEIKKRIELDFVLFERGNTKYDRETHQYERRTYEHKLFFAKFDQEFPLELVHKLRGMQLNGRTIFVRRADENLNDDRCVFVRGIRGTCSIEDVVERANQFIQRYDKNLYVDDIKMLYNDRKLRGFMYFEFNQRIPREVGDRIFMRAFEVNGDPVQLKKYVGAKKLGKQKIADHLGYKKQAHASRGQARSVIAEAALKRGRRDE